MHEFLCTNATVRIDEAGVTIVNKLFGRTKTIAWSDVGAIHIEKGTWLTRPKLFAMTRAEVAFSASGVRLLQRAAASQSSEWMVVGDAKTLEAIRDAVERRLHPAAASAMPS
ncbi:MAG: PH domain-containing protein [Polyangiales bacterium]